MITRVYNKRVLIPIEGVPIKELERHIAEHLGAILMSNEHILRHAIVGKERGMAIIEMVIAEANRPLSVETYPKYELEKGAHKVIVHIIPTGVKAKYGGYIADGSPVNNLLASVCDYVITNPNTVNSAVTTYMSKNVVYTEGYTLDNFFLNRVVLRPPKKLNRVGLILDRGIDNERVIKYAFQTAEMCRLAGGISIPAYCITDEHVESRSFQNESGAITGEIGQPLTLIRAMEKILKNRAHEIDTIVVGTQIAIPEGALDLYHKGEIPDPHGGLEAVISHLLSWRSGKMVAHGPLLYEQEIRDLLVRDQYDPRAAGEIIGSIGYLGCVIKGLSRAPEIHFLNVNSKETISPQWLKIADVAAIVAPWNCLGGIPMLVAAARGIPIIAVKDNDTLLNVSRDTLNYGDSVVEVENYLEAAALAKRIVNGHPHLLSDKEQSELLSEGFEIAEETGMAIESLIRPVVPFEVFARG